MTLEVERLDRLYLNGHEYLKRQLTKEGPAFEALDNGIRSCADPRRRQTLADNFDGAVIDAVLRRWLARPCDRPPPRPLSCGPPSTASIVP